MATESDTTTKLSLADLPISAFLNLLYDAEPTPGGGSAAALAGSMAAALVRMVAGITAKKRGFEVVAEDMNRIKSRSAELGESLRSAIDDDASAYDRVLAAFSLPKETSVERELRQIAVQAGLTNAAAVPLGVARNCLETARLASSVLRQGNPNAASDSAVAALLAVCAVHCALINVAINLASLEDTDVAAELGADMDRLRADGVQLHQELWSEIVNRFPALGAHEHRESGHGREPK